MANMCVTRRLKAAAPGGWRTCLVPLVLWAVPACSSGAGGGPAAGAAAGQGDEGKRWRAGNRMVSTALSSSAEWSPLRWSRGATAEEDSRRELLGDEVTSTAAEEVRSIPRNAMAYAEADELGDVNIAFVSLTQRYANDRRLTSREAGKTRSTKGKKGDRTRSTKGKKGGRKVSRTSKKPRRCSTGFRLCECKASGSFTQLKCGKSFNLCGGRRKSKEKCDAFSLCDEGKDKRSHWGGTQSTKNKAVCQKGMWMEQGTTCPQPEPTCGSGAVCHFAGRLLSSLGDCMWWQRRVAKRQEVVQIQQRHQMAQWAQRHRATGHRPAFVQRQGM
eukprot:TRINITY_DN2976_c0_g1_i6.p1 TRINITY_DN2976_c0_g1~~TRINITY_DN2976_c0_g1_i6.p1  ORF type:complete len:330 (+),score=43.80 TRINITY_DN2976_c0_g1_i6:111-1100(+)